MVIASKWQHLLHLPQGLCSRQMLDPQRITTYGFVKETQSWPHLDWTEYAEDLHI